MGAGRAARTVAWIRGNVLGDWAVRSGWLARASAILGEAGEDGPERGWVLIIRAFSEPDAQMRESLSREAIAIGRRFADPDIEFLAVAYLGGVYLMVDRQGPQAFAGTAPVTRSSGLRTVVVARAACNQRLVDACYLWAFAA
jgi:hypothetical protein